MEEEMQNGENSQRLMITNKELIQIEQEMERVYNSSNLNSLNLYMYGVILKSRKKDEKAKEVLVKALNKYPLLWSAWMELNMMLTKNDRSLLDRLPNHWVKNFMISSFYIKI